MSQISFGIVMINLDDSIGNILLNLQKDGSATFKKLIKQAQEEHPELFEDNIKEYDKIDKD